MTVWDFVVDALGYDPYAEALERGRRAFADAAIAANGLRRCAYCEERRPAVCAGIYCGYEGDEIGDDEPCCEWAAASDDHTKALLACSKCCGHFQEGGWCLPLDEHEMEVVN